jgi:hypothetical protein
MLSSLCGPVVMGANALVMQRTPDNNSRHLSAADAGGGEAGVEKWVPDHLTLLFALSSAQPSWDVQPSSWRRGRERARHQKQVGDQLGCGLAKGQRLVKEGLPLLSKCNHGRS